MANFCCGPVVETLPRQVQRRQPWCANPVLSSSILSRSSAWYVYTPRPVCPVPVGTPCSLHARGGSRSHPGRAYSDTEWGAERIPMPPAFAAAEFRTCRARVPGPSWPASALKAAMCRTISQQIVQRRTNTQDNHIEYAAVQAPGTSATIPGRNAAQGRAILRTGWLERQFATITPPLA